jgi:hypothetical protein
VSVVEIGSLLPFLCPKWISASGLLFDIVGIALLFRYQVDLNHQMSSTGSIKLVLEQSDEAEAVKWHWYRKLTRLGFALLIIGFCLQLTGTLCA